MITLDVCFFTSIIANNVMPYIQNMDKILLVPLDTVEVILFYLIVLIVNHIGCFGYSKSVLKHYFVSLFCVCNHLLFKFWLIHFFKNTIIFVLKVQLSSSISFEGSTFSHFLLTIFFYNEWVVFDDLIVLEYLTFCTPRLFKLFHLRFLLLLSFHFFFRRNMLTAVRVARHIIIIRFNIVKLNAFHGIIGAELIFINFQLVINLRSLIIKKYVLFFQFLFRMIIFFL